jgi:hypothetical protein
MKNVIAIDIIFKMLMWSVLLYLKICDQGQKYIIENFKRYPTVILRLNRKTTIFDYKQY